MRQLNQLRDYLLNSVCELKQFPEKLQVWTADGKLDYKSQEADSNYKNTYKAQILIQDFSGSVETIAMPLIAFAKKYSDARVESVAYEVEILDENSADVLFTLPLSDDVRTHIDGNVVVIKPSCEPVVPEWVEAENTSVSLVENNRTVATWTR